MSFSSDEKININNFLFSHYSKNDIIVLHELREYLRKLCNDKGFINEYKINVLISKQINNLLSSFIFDFNKKNPNKYVKIKGNINVANTDFYSFSDNIILYGTLNITSIVISLLNYRIKNKLLIKDSDNITLDNVLVLGDIIYTHSIAHEYSDKVTLNIDITNTFGSHILIKNVNGNTNVNGNNDIISLNYRGNNKLYGENLELTSLSNIKCVDEILLDYDINYIYTKILELKDINTNNTNESKYKISGLNSKILKLENIQNNSSNFEIRNCKIDKIIIKNSNLGKAVFNGVNIGKLEIQNTTLNDCIFNGVDIEDYELEEIVYKPTIIKIIEEYKHKTDIEIVKFVDYKCMKDNYRQLKHVMDKNANYTEANRFYSLEMLYYARYIQNGKNYSFLEILKNEFKCNNSKKYGELIILTIGALINDFGTNILKNLFIIWGYLVFIYSISYFTNFISWGLKLLQGELDSSINISIDTIYTMGHICGIFILFILFYFLLKYKINLIEKTLKNKHSTLGFIFFSIAYIVVTSIILNDVANFKGINTFVYLINPFSGLTPSSMSHLLWTEQIGMIIHKVIYGILIYQLIVALKRTTKR